MINLYFFYDPDQGCPVFFPTETERDIYTAKELEEYRRHSCDNEECSDIVWQIVCGVITHATTTANRQVTLRPPEEEIDDDGLDEEGNSWTGGEKEIVTYDVVMAPVVRED